MISRAELNELYCYRHLTLEEIGKIYNVTRQAIYYACKKYGIKAEQGERVLTECDQCGKSFERPRKNWRKRITHYCSRDCYFASRKNGNYRASRYGQRIARQVMAKHIGRPLMSSEIVHHIDGNCNNNSLSNLMLFPTHGAHLKHHHLIRQSKCNGY